MIATELLIHDSYSRVTDEEVAMLHADREHLVDVTDARRADRV